MTLIFGSIFLPLFFFARSNFHINRMISIDQMGREVLIPFPPKRIVSLVPSQTELLFDLGLEQLLVGITKFCIHPKEKVKSITQVGGTKNIKIEKVRALKPCLIIGNKEENYQGTIEVLAAEFPVWTSDIQDISDAMEMIVKIGEITDTKEKAEALVAQITRRIGGIKASKLGTAVYLIWNEPLMVAANSTFVNEMIKLAGFENVFSHLERYPAISQEEINEANPDFILLSSEPYPFKEKHVREFQELYPRAKIKLVDGELFSWYGSRMLKAPEYFNIIRAEIQTR